MIKLELQNISTKKRSRLCIADGCKNLEQEAENWSIAQNIGKSRRCRMTVFCSYLGM